MHGFTELIKGLEDRAEEIDKLEQVFSRMSISRMLSPEVAKSVAADLAVLADKIKEIYTARAAAAEKLKNAKADALKIESEAIKVANGDFEIIEAARIAREEAHKAADEELGNDGFNIAKIFLDTLFVTEYELIVSIIAKILGTSAGEAKQIPVAIIHKFIIRDELVRMVFPRLVLSELNAQSDTLRNLAASHSQPTVVKTS